MSKKELTLCTFSTLTDCGHIHKYVVTEKVEPISTRHGYNIYTCECGNSYKGDITGILKEELHDENSRFNVLFIGNSYTYYNEIWNEFSAIASKQGYIVTVDNVTKGNWTLQQMGDQNDVYGAQVEEKLKSKAYNIVFLQEQSTRPATDPALFFDSVRKLVTKIRENGAIPVLYETWGRKTGNEKLDELNMTNHSMTQKLVAAYTAIGKELNVAVSHVGTAFYDVYTNNKTFDLYNEDKTHPSKYGTQLAAMVHYATVYGVSPIGMKAKIVNSAEIQSILEKAAHKAVFGESIIEDKYKMSSEGITNTGDEKIDKIR